MLDEKKLLELIAASPRIRTMELVDKLDCEFSELEPLLLQQVAAGKLVAQPVSAPNGRQATGYTVGAGVLVSGSTDEKSAKPPPLTMIDKAIAFVTERGTATSAELHSLLRLMPNDLVSRVLAAALADGRLVKNGKFWSLAGAEGESEQDDAAATADHPLTAITNATFPGTSAPTEPPTEAPTAEPEFETKGDRVVEFIQRQANRRATNSQLREVLGLGAGQFPAAYLNDCIKSGRLARHGDNWILGPGASAEDRGEVPLAGGKAIEIPVFANQKSDIDPAPSQAAPPAEKSACFRIGDWSDGTVELQRDGVRVASLTKEEFDQVGRFWNLRAA
jgi:hypothetical protein